MPRRSKRKQNRRKNHKQNSHKLEKQNLSKNVNIRSDGPALPISELENYHQNKISPFDLEFDSDPDVFFEFHLGGGLNRAKSDSALNKLNKYIGTFLSLDQDSSSRDSSDAEKTELHASVDSCCNTLTDSVSTTQTVDSSDTKLISKLKSYSAIQMKKNGCHLSMDTASSLNLVKERQKDEQHLNMTVDPHCGVLVQVHSEETISNLGKMEKSFENFSHQMMMKLSDEALELGITAIPPKRLHSNSNIFISNCSKVSCCTATSLTGLEKISGKVYPISNKHFPTTSPKSDHEEIKEEDNKIYLKAKKNEKHLLNCSLLGEEPQSRSTPILRTKSKESWKSHMQRNQFSDTALEGSFEEYRTCDKEFVSRTESQGEDELRDCLSQYMSCRDIAESSKEVLKIFPPETENFVIESILKASLNDVSVQCEILRLDSETMARDTAEKDEKEEERKYEGEAMDSSLMDFPRCEHYNFQTFKNLFTKMSAQKFLHILSVLPMDKILEFFCLTFSIPLIETMAISISITKVMNILSTVTFFPNLNERIKNYTSKTLHYLRVSWDNLSEMFIKYSTEEMRDSPSECRMCFCDAKKMTDLEKRLKNLENEITRFQFVEAEIERLQKIAQSFEQVSTQSLPCTKEILTPLLPPPPPPPPPPLPPTPVHSFVSSQIKPKKTAKAQDSVSRPSITVEDLQKVILRKVTTNEKQGQDARKGPVVSLEMLRSVKLRSSARKKTPTCSPTRTPTSRERIRRIKSPFRSTSRSRDRKSRYPNIPLSEILGMEDTYHLYDHKTGESQKTESSTFY